MTTEWPTLTTTDLKALRSADTIVFRCNKLDDRHGPLGTYADLTKSYDPGDGFGKRDLCSAIDLAPALINNYTDRGEVSGCTEVCLSARFNNPLVTALAMMRPGDVLQPNWVAGNDSERLKEAHFTVDEFHLRVIRETPKTRKAYDFFINANVGTAHSSVRNIRFG